MSKNIHELPGYDAALTRTPRARFVEAMRCLLHHSAENVRLPACQANRADIRAACEAFTEETWPDGVYAPNAKADYRAAIVKEVFDE